MKKIFFLIKTFIKFFRCFNCAHRLDCPYSTFVVYNGVKYLLTVEKFDENKEEAK